MPSFNEELQLPNHSQVTGFCKSFSSICSWVFLHCFNPKSLTRFICTPYTGKSFKTWIFKLFLSPQEFPVVCLLCFIHSRGNSTTALPFYFSLQEKETTKNVLAPQTQVSLVEYYTREMAFHWGWGKMLFTRRWLNHSSICYVYNYTNSIFSFDKHCILYTLSCKGKLCQGLLRS